VRRLTTLLVLCGALSASAQQPKSPPPPPPLPPPEGAPRTPALERLIEGRGEIVRVITGYDSLDGLAWLPADGLTFTDPGAHLLVTWSPASKTEPVTRVDGSVPTGLAADAQGRLVVAERNTLRVTRREKGQVTTLVDRVDGQPLRGPSEVTVAPNGDVYVADFGSGGGRVIRVTPGFQTSVVVSDVAQPAGVGVSPAGTMLYVADSARSELRAYPIDAQDVVGAGRRLTSVTPWKSGVNGRPAGVLVDRAGHIFLAGPGGVWVLDENGGRLGVIAMPERPSACALGDVDERTLYIAAETSIYKVRLRR
jgi:sugar lactone lactonase YvrE